MAQSSEEPTCSAGEPSPNPGSRRSSGKGNSYPLQYSYLENSMDREAWQSTVHGITKSQTQLSETLSLSLFILALDSHPSVQFSLSVVSDSL